MKLSTGLRAHVLFVTFGSDGRTGATNAQCFSIFASFADALSGHSAPASIHRRIKAICSLVNGSFFSGIRSSPCRPMMRCTSRLSALLPGTITWPETPPFIAAAFASRRNSACAPSPLWHDAHDAFKIGATSLAKSIFSPCATFFGMGGSLEAAAPALLCARCATA